jgi:hypothetical protein
MGAKAYNRSLAAYLFEGGQPIDELSQQQRPNPASRYLNRRYELSELMRQTITNSYRGEEK